LEVRKQEETYQAVIRYEETPKEGSPGSMPGKDPNPSAFDYLPMSAILKYGLFSPRSFASPVGY
jgi:hypothetical protein